MFFTSHCMPARHNRGLAHACSGMRGRKSEPLAASSKTGQAYLAVKKSQAHRREMIVGQRVDVCGQSANVFARIESVEDGIDIAVGDRARRGW